MLNHMLHGDDIKCVFRQTYVFQHTMVDVQTVARAAGTNRLSVGFYARHLPAGGTHFV
jgi:hypothetical protein